MDHGLFFNITRKQIVGGHPMICGNNMMAPIIPTMTHTSLPKLTLTVDPTDQVQSLRLRNFTRVGAENNKLAIGFAHDPILTIRQAIQDIRSQIPDPGSRISLNQVSGAMVNIFKQGQPDDIKFIILFLMLIIYSPDHNTREFKQFLKF